MTAAIDRAIVPIAGLATRMGPLCRAVPKAMLPLPGEDGSLSCVLHAILAETVRAGIRQVALILRPDHETPVRAYLSAARKDAAAALPDEVRYIRQPRPEGFGAAVLRAEAFTDGRPFLLKLGDHLHLSDPGEPPCTAQLLDAFASRKAVAMVGVQTVGEQELAKVGVCAGEPLDGRVYRCRALAEKPSLQQARRELATPGLPEGTWLAHNGLYAFSAEIFDCLREIAEQDSGEGELELAAAQQRLLQLHPGDYLLHRSAGVAMDTGSPPGYLRAFASLLGRA
ncbi:MAG: sugar phosphate nucleotidyltransferase [Phycisphaerae bacterium]